MMDKKQERLRERYEDALFAIMMDELASSLGQEALEENERLNNDPDAAVPEQIERKCMQTIRNHYRKAAVKKAGRVALDTLSKTAMVFGLACALFVGAFAASEDVRITTMNLIVETFGESTDFHFVAAPSRSVPQIKAGWVPEGFELEDEGADGDSSWFTYLNDEGQHLRALYVLGEGTLFSIDTENVEASPIQIQGATATLMVKENQVHIAWVDSERQGFVEVFGNGISSEDLIRVAENMIL